MFAPTYYQVSWNCVLFWQQKKRADPTLIMLNAAADRNFLIRSTDAVEIYHTNKIKVATIIQLVRSVCFNFAGKAKEAQSNNTQPKL